MSEATSSALRSVALMRDRIDAGRRDFHIAPGCSVELARRHLAREFRRHGLDAPALDARILVGHVLALDHAALAAQSDRALTAEEASALA
ncbi:MAG: hypothetical protein WBW74_01865, partial [Xanthobacteraceae bacterium]